MMTTFNSGMAMSLGNIRCIVKLKPLNPNISKGNWKSSEKSKWEMDNELSRDSIKTVAFPLAWEAIAAGETLLSDSLRQKWGWTSEHVTLSIKQPFQKLLTELQSDDNASKLIWWNILRRLAMINWITRDNYIELSVMKIIINQRKNNYFCF